GGGVWCTPTWAERGRGQTVLVGYRPQKAGAPRERTTALYRFCPPPMNDLQESTPHSRWVGSTAADLAWTSTRAGAAGAFCTTLLLAAGLASGNTPTTAVYFGVVGPDSHACTEHVLPVLHAWSTRCPCSS